MVITWLVRLDEAGAGYRLCARPAVDVGGLMFVLHQPSSDRLPISLSRSVLRVSFLGLFLLRSEGLGLTSVSIGVTSHVVRGDGVA